MLSRLKPKEQGKKISKSKQEIKNKISRRITSFSNLYVSFNSETIETVKRFKFKAVCTVVQEPVVKNNNPYLLPRFTALDWNWDEFEKQLQKWLNFGY